MGDIGSITVDIIDRFCSVIPTPEVVTSDKFELIAFFIIFPIYFAGNGGMSYFTDDLDVVSFSIERAALPIKIDLFFLVEMGVSSAILI